MSYWDGTRWLPDRPPSPVPTRPRGRVADWLATAVMLGGLAVILFPGNPSAAAGPRLSASPASARPGDMVSISGSGFVGGSTVQLAWDGSARVRPFIRVNSGGAFEVRVTVGELAPGEHSVAALRVAVGTRGFTRNPAIPQLASVAVTVLAPVVTTSSPSQSAATEALISRQTAATPAPTVVPTPDPTAIPTTAPPPKPAAGLPTIDPSYGTIFRKVFTDGTFGPFRVLTYPDDHIGGSGQFMTVYNRFSNGARQASVHDGYLDLRATPRGDGLWDAALVGTSQGGNGPTFGYGVYRFWLRFNAAPATWQSAWLYDTTSWSATEIDFPEMLENMSLTAHVLGQGAGAAYGLPRPSNLASVFHEFKVERRATFVAFSIDGAEVARVNGSMPNTRLAILLDSKVGFGWTADGGPSGSTPELTYLHVAAVTVDP